nr:DegT/DnrJ/EryC1/StrS family aminotransferase [uncultured Roseateles sp.]
MSALEAAAAQQFGFLHAVALNGAGAALDLVLKALDAGLGSEVICGAATFHGQHLSVLGSGATLRLADLDPKTYCISADAVNSLLGPTTLAVIATDLHGASANYTALRAAARESSRRTGYQAPILIGDSARSVPFVQFQDEMGAPDILILSMQSKKMWTTLGEGGLVLSNDEGLVERLREYRSFGIGRAWGSNYKLSKLQASVGVVQLRRLPEMLRIRQELAAKRTAVFASQVPLCRIVNCESVNHCYSYYPIELPSDFGRLGRDLLIEMLAQKFSIGSVVANPPTYLYNEWVASRTVDRPLQAAVVTDRLICVPLHPSISPSDEGFLQSSFVTAYHHIARQLRL